MKRSKLCRLSVPMLAAGPLALSGCGGSSGNPTNISYRPIGICKGYETPAGLITTGPNKGFAVFKIESVDNTGHESSFIFAPERLFVNQSPPVLVAGSANRRFVSFDPRFAQSVGFTSIQETPVAAGEKCDINSVVAVPLAINNPSGGAEANEFSFELAYDTGVGDKNDQQNVNDGIVFTITNPANAKASMVENCKVLPFK